MSSKSIYIILLSIIAQLVFSCNSNQETIVLSKNYCIRTNRQAVDVAQEKWLEMYGNSINNKKPFIAQLKNDTIWVVRGSLRKWVDGGVPYAEINAKNCKFVKINHSK